MEETLLFVDGIGLERASDITSAPFWNHQTRRREGGTTSLPLPRRSKFLLVPKAVVHRRGIFDPGENYRHYVQVWAWTGRATGAPTSRWRTRSLTRPRPEVARTIAPNCAATSRRLEMVVGH